MGQFPNSNHLKYFSGIVTFLSLGYKVEIPPSEFWYCTGAIYAFFTGTLCSILFIVSMTFDRFYSIIRPHKAASFNTVKRAKITIACIVMFSLLFNIPHFFISSHKGWLCLPFGNVVAMAKGYSQFYYWLSLTLQFLLPFVLLLIMNSFIIRTLQKRVMQKIALKVDNDNTQNRS